MRKLIRIFSLWILPILVFILISLAGFIWWCFASQAGTRWLLQTAVSQFNGQANGIRGSLRTGLYVDNLNIELPTVKTNLFGLHLKIVWSELFNNRTFHINDISLEFLDLEIHSSTEAETDDSEEFTVPVLPVNIQLDHLALGGLSLNIDNEPLPVELLSVDTSFSLDSKSAKLSINELRLAKDSLLVHLTGDVALSELAKPWPFKLNLDSNIQDSAKPSMLCSATWLQLPANEQRCKLDVNATAAGSLDSVNLDVLAHGTDIDLTAKSEIFPLLAFPLGASTANLQLSNDAGLDFKLDPGPTGSDGAHLVNIDLLVKSLGLNHWLPDNIGHSELNLKANVQTKITAANEVQSVSLGINMLEHNKWNGKDLSGHLKLAKIYNLAGLLWPIKQTTDQAHTANTYQLDDLVVDDLDVDLLLGDAKIYMAGDLAAQNSTLALNVAMPTLATAWPDIPGGVHLNTVVFGNLALLNGGIQAKYVLDDPNATELLKAPVDLQLTFKTSLNHKNELHAELSKLDVSHAQANIVGLNTIVFDLLADQSWQLGNTEIAVNLEDQNLLNLQIQKSGGHDKNWYSAGGIKQFIVDQKKIKLLQQWLTPIEETQGIITSDRELSDDKLELGLQWDLQFDQVLTGNVDLQRVQGDITVPTEIPVKLDLKSAGLNINFKPHSKSSSLISADLQIATKRMGSLRLRADTPLHVLADGGFSLNENDPKNIHLQAESEDLAWLNLFLGGAQEIGGTIDADIKGNSLANGSWNLSGPLVGHDLSFVIPDQGVRLLNGVLEAKFDGMRLVLNKLHFPAIQRVIPQDSRVAKWLADDPEAQDGYLDVSGNVNLEKQDGTVTIALRRYPVVQRADRYVMASGDLTIDLAMPSLVIIGDMTVDTGWFDIDMLNDIPELSSDVIILKRGATVPESEPDLVDIKADITIDMGSRFFVTGFGLDTGIVGNLGIRLLNNRMRAIGALRTRGGYIKAYGQSLVLRRGRITFQGDITNPTLDIEALRTGLSVQAGVGVTGTARHPIIGLVSYPNVSETEKLTWLLLGRGPDGGGAADMTLLFSVGSSLIGGGEPFYKRFGIDELSIRSGELGSAGSILPAESVVTDMDSSTSPIEDQFVVAGKQLTDSTKLTIEQALARTGTVARLSYELMRRLHSEVTVGTTNGLALVYRWFSRD